MAVDIATRIHADPGRPSTLSEQVREQLTWLISSGDLRPGDDLPSVRRFATSLGINFHTVRSAYRKLEADGLVETRQGRRTRVAPFDPRRLWPAEASARTHTVGIVLPTLVNPFYAAFLDGLDEVARETGTLPIVCATHDDQARALRSIAQLLAKGVDGLVVVSHDIAHLIVDEAGRGAGGPSALPLVVVDRPGIGGHSVEADLRGAGRIAAGHLVEHGHRAIGLVTVGRGHSNTMPLEDGFRGALREAGIPPDEDLVVRADGFSPTAGADACARLLRGGRRPSAIVAIADLLAIGVIRAARAAGLDVPRDVAVIGVDDIPLADAMDPPLTTVALPARAMGAEAMRTLGLAWAGTATHARKVMLETHLVIRESCGPHASP
ncbi:MAG: GntR family transcriptional regulator [Chloroflexi bacterium]|nr:GntR family transcriptional regulator [Chloroflexota bacterium]